MRPDRYRFALLALLFVPLLPAEIANDPLKEGLLRDEFVTDITLYSGIRTLEDENWQGLDQLFLVGLDYFTGRTTWPVAVGGSVGVAYGKVDDDLGLKYSTTLLDFSLGLRRTQRLGNVNLEVGAGGSGIHLRIGGGRGGRVDDNEWAWGGYGMAGLHYAVDNTWLIGARARYTVTETFEFRNSASDGDASGMSLVGLFGLRF